MTEGKPWRVLGLRRRHRLVLVARQAMAMFLVLLLACSGPARVVRLDTGEGKIISPTPRGGAGRPVDLGTAAFEQAMRAMGDGVLLLARPQATARQLFAMDARSGEYLYEARSHRLIPVAENALAAAPADASLTEEYLRWCGRTYGNGDCLGLLLEGPTVTGDGRYVAIAQGAVLGEMKDALRGMANPEALLSAALWTMTMFMLLWVVPEPLSKGIAATLTVALMGWLGVDTVWNLMAGWIRLVAEVDRAPSFGELKEAGERYGRVMGQSAARAFVMLATAAIGSTATGLAAKLPRLPGFTPAAVQAAAGANIRLSAVAGVSSVAVTAEGFTVALAPGAVAMAARGTPGSGRVEEHHIATNKNDVSAARGGPWTPRLKEIFARGGMTLEDAENKLPIAGHSGPHPERYHRIIHERLRQATNGCYRTEECRAALLKALDKLAKEIAKPGQSSIDLSARAELARRPS